MRGAGADHDAADRAPTPRAWLTCALVDQEMLLHRSVAFGRRVVVDRAAATDDRLGQDPTELAIQASFVGRVQARCGPERVQAGSPQGLIRVDVADARNERLVQQEWLQATAPRSEPLPELAERELVVERFGSGAGEDGRAADFADRLAGVAIDGIQPDLAELPDIPESKVAAIAERNHQPNVRVERRGPRDYEQLARHLQVDRHHRVPGQADDQLLAAPPDRLDPSAAETRPDRLGGMRPQGPGPQRRGPADLGIKDEAAEIARHRLHLG